MSAHPSTPPPSVRGSDVAAMRRAIESLSPPSDPHDEPWLREVMRTLHVPPTSVLGDFVRVVLERGGRAPIADFEAAYVHGAGWFRPFLQSAWDPRMPWGYLEPELVNRFFSERGGVS